MDKNTIIEMLNLLDIQRNHCIKAGSIQAKTSKLYLNENIKETEKQNIYYNGFMSMSENLLIKNGYYLRYNPVKNEHYIIAMN